jgi:hypothetical protein
MKRRRTFLRVAPALVALLGCTPALVAAAAASASSSAPSVLTTIVVSPSSVSVQTGGTQQFTATGLDQFGQPVNPQPTFSWSVTGGGTISPSGLFTAGATTGGPFTVTAAVGALAGTASVTVSPSARGLAKQLVSDSAGKGPGHALADKAAAIQAAVNGGQTAIACAGITDYLGLVNANSGEHLSASDAATLTSDANNLAVALRC